MAAIEADDPADTTGLDAGDRPDIDDLLACWHTVAEPFVGPNASDEPEAADTSDRPCPQTAAGDTTAQNLAAVQASAALSLAHDWPRLYPELRRLAGRLMAQERQGHTLTATALVHEAWLKLGSAQAGAPQVNDRHHFMALACRAMRHILVNHAQARLAHKRRGNAVHETLSAAHAVAVSADQPGDLLAVDQALRALAAEDPRAAQVAELRAFGGLEVREIAACLGVSEPTVKRDWVFARARLAQLLT